MYIGVKSVAIVLVGFERQNTHQSSSAQSMNCCQKFEKLNSEKINLEIHEFEKTKLESKKIEKQNVK